MDISVVFATAGRSSTLRKTLKAMSALDAGSLNWELIVVDNIGLEETKAMIDEYRTALPVRFLVETTKGKNFALNTALEHVKGELVVFTDDDVVPEPNWLHEWHQGAERWPETMVFGGRILPLFPTSTVPFDLTNNYVWQAFVIADWEIGEGALSSGRVWGPNMAIRKSVFDQGIRFNTSIGPSGKNYIMGSETELTWRLFDRGYEAVYLPNCLVHHQIREEQLSIQWLSERAFRSGRGAVAKEGLTTNLVLWFGIPRYYFRKLLTIALKMYFSRIFDRKSYFANRMDYYYHKGRAYQCWQGIPSDEPN